MVFIGHFCWVLIDFGASAINKFIRAWGNTYLLRLKKQKSRFDLWMQERARARV
jgi:hypothetical protein